MRKSYFKFMTALTSLLLLGNLCAVDFVKEVKPILESRCVKCHSSSKDKGDLNLETLEVSKKGGESGPAVVPGNPAKSLLIEKVKLPADHDDIMPPKGDPLSKKQISILEKWIQDGAKWPQGIVLKEIQPATDSKPAKKVDIKVPEIPQGHKVLAADKGIIAIIGYDGKIQWQYKARNVHALQMLENGNVLFQINRTTVIEVDPKTNKKVFEYNSATMNGNKGKKVEVHAFQRVENGLTMIAESGPGRIIEVDNKGKIVKEIKLKLNKPNPHRDTRQARKIHTGNYLVAHEGDGFIREYDKSGKVVWEYEVPLFGKAKKGGHGPDSWGNSVFDALRLPNGNTLIATGNGHSVIEVSPDKEVVWHLKQNDLKGITLAWVTTLQLMPNGNYVIGNCHAGPNNPQIIEINKDKEVVWQFKDFNNFGNNLSNSQIIDAAEDIAFYNNKVHHVLEKNCLKCHGHEEKEMKGGFWLESRYDVLKGGDIAGTRVYNPENPKESILLKHIYWADDDHQMPPKKQMSQADIDIITEWLARGLPFDPYKEKVAVGALMTEVNDRTKAYWAFKPVKKPAVPEVNNSKWARNSIDKFILSKLEAKDMKPNSDADRVTLVRRAYYDLIGLPPSPKEVEDFVNDNDPKAFENLIDKLLASKHYGEKWGRHWLDVVRFAETNSYERDGNKPHAWKYRQWVIDSLNKDKPYDQMVLEQLAGDELDNPTPETITATGYFRLGIWDDEPANRLQALYDEYDDIVKTTGEAFMGFTVGCARCHNHKIDPFPTKDYYSMLAFFHNIVPYSRGGHERTILTEVSSEARKKEIAAKNKVIAEKRQSVIDEMKKIEAQLAAKTGTRKSDMRNLTFKFYRETWDKLPDFDMFRPEETGKMPGNWFDISNASRKVSIGYVFEGELIVPETNDYTFLLNSDDGSQLFIDGKSLIKFDGIHGMNAKPLSKHIRLDKGVHKIKLTYFQKEHGYGLYAGWKFKGKGPVWDLSKPTAINNKDFRKIISKRGKEILGQKVFTHYKALEKKLNGLREVKSNDYVLSVREKGTKVADTFVFRRGSPNSPADKVQPRFPSVLTDKLPVIKATKKSSGARRAFAEWLVNDNPMTPKVMVNRIWQYHFGRGIVRTPNDFGNLGEKPTHPELLDYLAATFVENGWSIKKMHKLMMTSSAYRMSSKGNEQYLINDPNNDLFWRFNMRRLTGEELRDSILAVIGKLDKTYGGPSVYPNVSREVLAGQSKIKWKVNTPESHQYRRSIYTFQMRSLIFPLVESFDAATPDSSCAVRFETTLPTQALTMMNGELLNKSAELMAQDVRENAGKSLVDQVNYLWPQVTGQKPGKDDIKTAADFIAKMKTLKVNDEKALQQLCLIMLNLNEFIYLD